MFPFNTTEYCNIVESSGNCDEIEGIPSRREKCGDGSSLVTIGCTYYLVTMKL
jgi:hypothetical protein